MSNTTQPPLTQVSVESYALRKIVRLYVGVLVHSYVTHEMSPTGIVRKRPKHAIAYDCAQRDAYEKVLGALFGDVLHSKFGSIQFSRWYVWELMGITVDEWNAKFNAVIGGAPVTSPYSLNDKERITDMLCEALIAI